MFTCLFALAFGASSKIIDYPSIHKKLQYLSDSNALYRYISIAVLRTTLIL